MSRTWRVGIVKDSSRPMLGLHGLHTACRGLPGVEVVGHVDSDASDLEAKLAYTQARRHYFTLADMLDDEPPDLVVLCSRHPDDHLPQIRIAAEHGCHIYCEKPLAATLPEADAIVALVEQHGVTLGMAHPARHGLAFRTMKRLVQQGAIGVPHTIYGRGKGDHRGGGEDLVVLGTHILDLFLFLFGAPESVMAEVTVGGRPVGTGECAETVEPIGPVAGDHVFAAFRFGGDVRGLFESRRGQYAMGGGATPMGITVSGSEGTLALRFSDRGNPEPTLRRSREPGPPEAGGAFEDVALVEDREIAGAAPLEYELCGRRDIPGARLFLEANRFAVWDLMRAAEEGRAPEASVADARWVVEMIQGIYAAHLSRAVVNFPLVERGHPLDEERSRQPR